VPFGPWLPDVTDHKNPGLEVCRNALPGPGGYRAAPSASTASASTPGNARVLSAASFLRTNSQRMTVCATAGDLHVIIGSTVTNSGLTLSLTEPVSFSRFGAAIYATNKSGAWKLDNIETDDTFAAASNTIPFGRAMARISDFLFMGNLTDIDTSDRPLRIRWSPFNNPGGEWETDIGTQSDAVDMPADLGPVMGITGGNTGIIFQRNGLSRIVYTGGASVFAKQEVDRERGLVSSLSLAQVGDRVFYLSDDGFFVTDGGPGESISRGRIWEWWLANAAGAHFDKVQAAVDWPNRCVFWTVPGDTGQTVALLCHNWETGNWSVLDMAPEYIFASGRDGVTLEQVSAIYPDLDAMPISLDSPEFLARGRSLAGFFGGDLCQITGDSLPAQFETGEFQPAPGRRAFVREVTPIITDDAASARVTLRGRDDQRSILRAQADVALGSMGFAPMAFDARYFRVAVSLPAGAVWTDAFGFQMDMEVSGHG